MIKTVLTKEKIVKTSELLTWEEAIKKASVPLVNNGSIEIDYVHAMIRHVKEMGPYIVIAPHIAFAHARPEEGANRTDISLLIPEQPVSFSEKKEHQCRIIFAFSATDNESHLELLSELSLFLSDEENVKRLLNAKNEEEVYRLIQK